MNDSNARKKLLIRKQMIASGVLLIISLGIFYALHVLSPAVESYERDKASEAGLSSQIESLTAENAKLSESIQNTGKELISFSEDKLKYTNLASTLAMTSNVHINKLSVSNLVQDGQMTLMPVEIEIEGSMADVTSFVTEYCGSNGANRIKAISYRPTDDYPWLARGIDGEKILTWFTAGSLSQGNPSAPTTPTAPSLPATSTLDEGEVVAPGGISLMSVFAPRNIRVYLKVDFLGRS